MAGGLVISGCSSSASSALPLETPRPNPVGTALADLGTVADETGTSHNLCGGSLTAASNPLCTGTNPTNPDSIDPEKAIRGVAAQQVEFKSGAYGVKDLNPALQAVINNSALIAKSMVIVWQLDANDDQVLIGEAKHLIIRENQPQEFPIANEITDFSPLFNTSAGGQPEMVAIVGSGLFSLHDANYYEKTSPYQNLPVVVFEPEFKKEDAYLFYTAQGQTSAPNTVLTAMRFNQETVDKIAKAGGHIREAVFVSPVLPPPRVPGEALIDWEDGMIAGLKDGTITDRAVVVSPLRFPYTYSGEMVPDPNGFLESVPSAAIDIGDGLMLVRRKIPVTQNFPVGSLLFKPPESSRSPYLDTSVWWTEITRKK